MARSAELAEPGSVTTLRPGHRSLPGGGRLGDPPRLLLGAIGVAQAVVFGVSGLFDGYYDFSVWGVASALTLVALAAALVLRPRPPVGPALVVVGGLLALLLLSALSLTWADSLDRAWTEVNRLVFYVATFLLATIVLRPGRSVRVVAGVLGGSIAASALFVLARLLIGDGGVFLEFRLSAPADYINGTACLMLMGIWPLVAFAERDRSPLLAGVGVALASVEASLLVLTEARAVIPAMLGSAILLLAVVPGRLARFWTLAAVTAGAVLALPWTLAAYSRRVASSPDGPSSSVVLHAGLAVLVASLAVGVLWGVVRRIAARPLPPSVRRVPRLAAICVLVATPVAILVADHDPLRAVRTQWRHFTKLEVSQASTAPRFTDVGGYRYDLWRVAVEEFEAHPLRGVGAGSYGLRYFQLRDNPQSVRQPHSIEFQMLAELGLPGLLALLVFIGGVGWALVRSRVADISASVALGGTFLVWLIDTSVDWIYNMPGLTGIALLSAAGLCAVSVGGRRGAARLSAPWIAAVLTLIALGAPSLVRQYVADERSNQAAAALPAAPLTALRDTQSALRLDRSDVDTYYTRAAAYARLGNYGAARATLIEAVRIEPLNYVPWALLGDLATRRGDIAQATAAYASARKLDPGDADLFMPPSASG